MDDITPQVTVVIGCHQDGPALTASLDSITAQHEAPAWECLVVANGPFQAGHSLQQRLATDRRFRLLHSSIQGLTEALILGCAQARGMFIARLDVGDAMAPDRLQRQMQLFRQHPDLVLATSDVEICGPAWEYLRTDSQPAANGVPLRVDSVPAEQGIAIDIPHHASVMFRRDAYEKVGGYRPEFYFGQDWDLWYRLACIGTFVHLPDVLTRVRLFSDGLSSRHWREQRQIAQLSLACYVARSQGQSGTKLLQQAAVIRPSPKPKRWLPWDVRRAEGSYFIAEALRRNGDLKCRQYFLEALVNGFWKPKFWLRSIQATFL